MFKKVYIEITNSCNRNCSFCSTSIRKKHQMSIEEFEKVIHEVKKVTKYIYLHIKGEPLLHDSFGDILRICDENGMKVNITTNGTLLYKYKDLISKSNCIRQINISLHSYLDGEIMENLFSSVDYLNKVTKIYIVYRYWILKENFFDNYVIKELIKHYNFSSEIIDLLGRDNNIKINETLYVNKDKEFIWPTLSNNILNENGFCLGLKTHFGILSDGTVVPCCLDADGIINLGNIFDNDIEQILNSSRAKKILSNFQDNKRCELLCKHCSFKKM